MEVVASEQEGVAARLGLPFGRNAGVVAWVGAAAVVLVCSRGARAVGSGRALGAFKEGALVVRVVVDAAFGFEGIEEGLGLLESFEELFVDLLDVGDEFVDVEGQDDEGNEDEGREADCGVWV